MKLLSFLILMVLTSALFARSSQDDLSQKLAQQRKKQVSSVSYELFFDLKKGSDTFKGITTIQLELNHTKIPLTIDSMVKNIETVRVNGVNLSKFPQRKGSFDVPVKALAKKMTIEIAYSSEYSKESHGFKKITDPEDNNEYAYTDFEPYYAHWLFPCLDQPDLKATYTVNVKAPSNWRVIHNDLIAKEKKEGEFKMTSFHTTKPFSTYLFFLGAGPWEEWKDDLNGLPVVIHARKSMAKFVDSERIFDTTKKGLTFFNDYFGYTYPFPKYGQIFVPDFAAGAMENPGSVTINEQRFLYRGHVPSTVVEDRDNLILHEMAHMWFGDLVTMEWWNDLWLNESFATYAANLAQNRGLKSTFSGIDFLSTKTWGYWQDQLVTTHPIETNVPDVRTAKGIFDGITYAKGASALKQLHFYVGDDSFRDGLRSYFKTYAWKNTQRKDFINAIAKASGKDLSNWTRKWLQTAGPNRVQTSFNCEGDKISRAEIIQKKSVSGVVSPHRTRLGLYKKTGDTIALDSSIDVIYEDKTTPVKELNGRACPDFIIPNLDDNDYALFMLDEKSVQFAGTALKNLPEPLSRYQIWTILFQMVRDQELAPETFFTTASHALKVENDEVLIGILLGRHSMLRDQYFYYLTVEERALLAPQFEKIIWDRVLTAKKESSLQVSFFDFYVSIAQTKEAQERIQGMLSKNTPPAGIKLDTDRRWAMIRNLSVNGNSLARKIIVEESKKDMSTLGKRQSFAATVAFPDLASKKDGLKTIMGDTLLYSDLREASDAFFIINFPEINNNFLKDFYQKIKSIDWHSNDDLVDIYFERLFPFEVCTKENEELSLKTFKSTKNLTSIARKGWQEANDELSRCVKVRSKKSNVVSR